MSNVFYMQNPAEAKALYCGFALSVSVVDVQGNDQETSKNLRTLLVKEEKLQPDSKVYISCIAGNNYLIEMLFDFYFY